MTESELEALLKTRLTRAGVAEVLDAHRSQFLKLESELFAEIVLTDASKQPDAERVMKEASGELQVSGTRLGYVVRSLWKIGEVRYLGPAISPEGGLRTAVDFRATLQSGGEVLEVRVDVTIAALDVLRQKLGKDKWVMRGGWSPKRGDVDEKNVSAAITAYLDLQLSCGGMSYWDPLLNPHLELNEAAMSYVLGHGAAFQELYTAITEAFSEVVMKSFLGSLNVSGLSLSDFDRALPELSNVLGGAFRRGERFSISASELYDNLNVGERQLLRDYFLIRAKKVRDEHPELVKQFPRVFAKSP